MDLNIPRPAPREDGDYATYVDIGYGKPYGTIHLADSYGLSLGSVTAEDCDRLTRAAAKVKEKILRYQAEAAVPHGRKNVYQGTCQLCGKPEADELHADTDPPGCICDVASADQCPVHRSEAAAEPELTVRERAQRGARKAAEREAAGKGDLEDAAAQDEDEPETVPDPTGFCGHPVHPSAWALGLTKCRDCLGTENRPVASVTA